MFWNWKWTLFFSKKWTFLMHLFCIILKILCLVWRTWNSLYRIQKKYCKHVYVCISTLFKVQTRYNIIRFLEVTITLIWDLIRQTTKHGKINRYVLLRTQTEDHKYAHTQKTRIQQCFKHHWFSHIRVK